MSSNAPVQQSSSSVRRPNIIHPGDRDARTGATNDVPPPSRASTSSSSFVSGRPAGSAGGARVVIPGAETPSSAGTGMVNRPSSNTILVNPCQKGNPVINQLKNVAWEYASIVPDYQVGGTSCVLFLSIRYHALHPEYIHGRISKLGNAYFVRILLVMVDAENHADTIKELTKVALINGLTLMLAWSNQEAARYLEIYKNFEKKPADLIKARVDTDYMSQLNTALTNVKGVNKSDVVTLISNFGSLKEITSAPAEELLACPGLGDKKVKRLREAFTAPFMVGKKRSMAERRAEVGNELN